MMMPTVHLNGTSGDELIRQLQETHEAIRNAMEALAGSMPNGRDYYVQESDNMSRAMVEYRDRYHRLESVANEIMEIWEGVQDQIDQRKSRRAK